VIFVDTGGWVAFIAQDEEHHLLTKQWIQQNRQPLVTTDYVLDESLTLLKARGKPKRAEELGTLLFGGSFVQLYYLSPNDILSAWQMFLRYSDKDWSFTDCTSRVVIEKLRCRQAFSFDQHFRQFGIVTVVP
jgi:predicted nucleic acid-binding protein